MENIEFWKQKKKKTEPVQKQHKDNFNATTVPHNNKGV